MKVSLLLLVVSAGCIDYAPDVGPLNPVVTDDGGTAVVPGCDPGDSNDAVRVSFSRDVRPLMFRVPGGCATCHLGRSVSGLDLGSYTAMRRGGVTTGTRIVIDGDPCRSTLIDKIGKTPNFGSRMPLSGPPYFTDEEVQIVHDWIAEGAANN
jgi:hypothetical protein